MWTEYEETAGHWQGQNMGHWLAVDHEMMCETKIGSLTGCSLWDDMMRQSRRMQNHSHPVLDEITWEGKTEDIHLLLVVGCMYQTWWEYPNEINFAVWLTNCMPWDETYVGAWKACTKWHGSHTVRHRRYDISQNNIAMKLTSCNGLMRLTVQWQKILKIFTLFKMTYICWDSQAKWYTYSGTHLLSTMKLSYIGAMLLGLTFFQLFNDEIVTHQYAVTLTFCK